MSHEFSFAFLNAMGSPMELLVIAFAVLMLFGAKSLPNALRTLGKWQHKCSRAWQEIQRELIDAEQPFENARKTWEEEMQEFTVSSSSRSRTTPPTDPTDAADPTDPTDQTDPASREEKPHAD